jgi:hypothetical protein
LITGVSVPQAPHDWLTLLDGLLNQLIEQQHEKVLQLARQLVPNLTPEDLRNPQDFPRLSRDPEFNYADGVLTGLRSALIAVRAELRRFTE